MVSGAFEVEGGVGCCWFFRGGWCDGFGGWPRGEGTLEVLDVPEPFPCFFSKLAILRNEALRLVVSSMALLATLGVEAFWMASDCF